MAQFHITILHGLFLSNGRDEAFFNLLDEIFNQVLLANLQANRAEPYSNSSFKALFLKVWKLLIDRVPAKAVWF